MEDPWADWPTRERKLDPLGYVYVIEFAVGLFHTVVKVGKTNSPRIRAAKHDHDVSRFGGTIHRAWLSEPHWAFRRT